MAEDKKNHMIAGFLIATITFAAGIVLRDRNAAYVAFAMAFWAGVFKEVYDATGRGHVEFWDAAATAAGGIPYLVWGFYG